MYLRNLLESFAAIAVLAAAFPARAA